MHLELSEKSVEEIAERVRQMLEAESPRPNEQSDPEAQELQRRLACIRVKEFVTVNEAALLLSCSNGHIRNLVKKAKKNQAKNPIPFIDLDGVTVFNREALLDWAEGSGRPL
jgi:hypothetical protein